MDNIFIQLAIILGLASSLGFIVQKFKLPLLIAYLLGGLLIASVSLFNVQTSKALSFLPEIGIAFVLFLVGMELDLREIKSIGKTVLISGLTQIIITTLIGSSIAKLFGFNDMESIYLGAGLSFSSTILIIKLLLDKKDLTSLYGKIAIGILLLEDLVAVVILLSLTVPSSILTLQSLTPLLQFMGKVILLFSAAMILNRFVLSSIFKAVSRQQELLFLTALAWCFIFISFSILLGFTVTIGAFLAGIALASSPYHFQIQGKVKPLRDFFVTLFFVYLGTKVNFADILTVYPVIILYTGYVLVFKPTIFLLLFGSFGYRKHTMFKAALCLTQVSEFSLIVLLVAFEHGVASQAALTTIALSSVLSMVIASIMISRSNSIYKYIKSIVSFFERKNYRSSLEINISKEEIQDHVVVIGGHQVGAELISFFKKEKVPHLVVDFNPKNVDRLRAAGINAIYGDISDPDVLDELKLHQAKMVISTAQDLEDNLLLLEELKVRKINIPVITRAESVSDAQILYTGGADYVIIPEVVAGDVLADKLRDNLGRDEFFRDRARIELEKLERKTLAWE